MVQQVTEVKVEVEAAEKLKKGNQKKISITRWTIH